MPQIKVDMDDLPEDNDMSDTAVEVNSGGRVRFTMGAEVRYIMLDGSVSTIHVIDQDRSDRKGYVSLKEKNGTHVVRVHHRRILPPDLDGHAVVVESQDKQWALCPKDGVAVEVSPGDTNTTCPKCSCTFTLHWIGVKPMAESTKTKDQPKEPKAQKAEKAAPAKAAKPPKEAKAAKPPKEVKEPVMVDITALAKTKHCELWTKKNVKFDHERIDVQAHVLLFNGSNPRKLCFNTYNGALGKKAGKLPVEAFTANEALSDAGAKKDTPWFLVEDLEKTRQKLAKDGYELEKA